VSDDEIHILIVDDNPDEVELMTSALRECLLTNPIDVARDGVEAMEYLRSDSRPSQLVILLDINMPKKNGFEVLDEIKASPELRPIPVVMLTTSSSQVDIVRSYTRGACSYVTKPVGFDDLMEIARNFSLYWTLVAKVPSIA